MKHILFMLIILLSIIVSANSFTNNINNSFLKSDNQQFSLTSGIIYNTGKYVSYSLFSYNSLKNINRNWSVYYNIDYLNRNYDNNLVNTGIGFNYKKNKFIFSFYISKTLSETDLYKLKYLNSLK